MQQESIKYKGNFSFSIFIKFSSSLILEVLFFSVFLFLSKFFLLLVFLLEEARFFLLLIVFFSSFRFLFSFGVWLNFFNIAWDFEGVNKLFL